jgi:hypothetical protein
MTERENSMTNTLKWLLVIGIVIYFMIVFNLLKKKRLQLKYSLLWMVMGIIMALLVVFPELLNLLCNLFGIIGTMNGLFCFSIGFILMLLMALTSIVSRQSSRITRLVQENALLEKKIRDLEFYKNRKELND